MNELKKREENDKEEGFQVIDLSNETAQLNAMRLFDANKKTLSSIGSFIWTYLIITIQFQMSSQ